MSDESAEQAVSAAEQPEEEMTLEQQFTVAKANYMVIKGAIDTREEPLVQMRELSVFIEKVVQDPTIFGEDKEFKDFFYQDLALGLLKRMNKERSADPSVSFAIS